MRAIREQIHAAIDVIMQLERQPDGRRVITAITELQGIEGDTILLQDIFRQVGGMGGEVAPTGLRPRFAETLAERGVDLPATVFRQSRATSGAPRISRPRINGPTPRVPRPKENAQ
jgi:pilus assembly protein CpaF